MAVTVYSAQGRSKFRHAWMLVTIKRIVNPIDGSTVLLMLRPMTPEFQAALDRFLVNAQAIVDEGMKSFPGITYRKVLSTMPGKRYIRVVVREVYPDGKTFGGSAHCFVDTTQGDILKCASWKAPAKHARGNIFNNDTDTSMSPYGAARLR